MIRYQITGSNPVLLNSAAKVLKESPYLEIDQDSGNRNGRKEGYIRYIHAKILRKVQRPQRFKSKLTPGSRRSLAKACWDRIVHKTDGDEEAIQAIIELIEHVERKYL